MFILKAWLNMFLTFFKTSPDHAFKAKFTFISNKVICCCHFAFNLDEAFE